MLVNYVSVFIRRSVASLSAPSLHLSIHSSVSWASLSVRADERVQIVGKCVRVCVSAVWPALPAVVVLQLMKFGWRLTDQGPKCGSIFDV